MAILGLKLMSNSLNFITYLVSLPELSVFAKNFQRAVGEHFFTMRLEVRLQFPGDYN
ncbi:hypothetical protein ACOSQ4_012877 [Xanthoceras sorbifolium]